MLQGSVDLAAVDADHFALHLVARAAADDGGGARFLERLACGSAAFQGWRGAVIAELACRPRDRDEEPRWPVEIHRGQQPGVRPEHLAGRVIVALTPPIEACVVPPR
jgi:hypothetical protein